MQDLVEPYWIKLLFNPMAAYANVTFRGKMPMESIIILTLKQFLKLIHVDHLEPDYAVPKITCHTTHRVAFSPPL